MFKTFSLRFLLASLALAALPTLGFALSSVTEAPVTVGTTDVSKPVSFDDIPTFDSSLGELVSVQFTLQLDATPFVVVTNTTSRTQSYRHAMAFEMGQITLDAPSLSGPDKFTVNSGVDKVPVSYGKLTKAGTPGATRTIFGPEVDHTSVFSISDPSNFYSSMVLGQTYDLAALFKEIPGFVAGSAAPGVNFSAGDDLFSSLTVTYFYDAAAVPEPSTWALMGISLVALALGRRFVTKRSNPSLS